MQEGQRFSQDLWTTCELLRLAIELARVGLFPRVPRDALTVEMQRGVTTESPRTCIHRSLPPMDCIRRKVELARKGRLAVR